MISFKPFFETLENKNISQYQLLKDNIIDNRTLDSIKRGGNLTLLTIEKLCKYLKCDIKEIVCFVDDEE